MEVKNKNYNFNKEVIEKILEIRKIEKIEKNPSLKELIDWVDFLGKIKDETFVSNEIKSPDKTIGIIGKTKNDINEIKNMKNE